MELSQRTRQIFILVGILSGAVLLFSWSFWLNRGTLIVEGKAPFVVDIPGVNSVNCNDSPCSITLPSRSFDLAFKKTGMFDEKRTIIIPKISSVRQKIDFSFEPKLTWEPLLKTPRTSRMSDSLRGRTALFSNGSVFVDGKPIVQFSGIDQPLLRWADSSHLWLLSGSGDLFLIDVTMKRKNRLETSVSEILSSPQTGTLFLRKGSAGEVRFVADGWQNGVMIPLPLQDRATAWGKQKLYLFSNANEVMEFFSFDPATQKVAILAALNLLQPTDVVLSDDEKSVSFQANGQKGTLRFLE